MKSTVLTIHVDNNNNTNNNNKKLSRRNTIMLSIDDWRLKVFQYLIVEHGCVDAANNVCYNDAVFDN